MSTLAPLGYVLAGLLALNVLLRLARTALRSPKVIHWVWEGSLQEPLGSAGLKPGGRFVALVAQALAKFAERPLRVEPFEGGKDVDAAGVSSALSAAMTRIGSLRRSGVDSVTAPVAAGTALDAIAAGVKAAPAGGELAAALLRIGWWLLARGELQLSGRVLESEAAGPGLALTIATASGRTIERLTIWAWEFEPAVGENASEHPTTDRLMCIATAGAVWTHFTILCDIWHLREEDLKELLQTPVWRSYAFMQVGLEGKDHRSPDVTRALYARAVDADPHNSVAQFNLASLELEDTWFEDVREAGLLRLKRVHDELDGEELSDPGPHGLDDELLKRKRDLLDRDPLHYQVAYKRGATKLNEDVVLDAEHEAGKDGLIVAKALAPADAGDIATHLRELEETLAVLHACDGRQWPAAGSKAWRELRQMLSAIEGTMLVLWAMMSARTGRTDGKRWPDRDLSEPDTLGERRDGTTMDGTTADGTTADSTHERGDRSADGSYEPGDRLRDGLSERRAVLIERLWNKSLTPGAAVHFARSNDVWRTTRTRLNLACWYADRGMPADSLRELELGLECGGDPTGHRMRDPQLRKVRVECAEDWEKLVLRYAPTRRAAPENGGRTLAPTFRPAATAPVNGPRGG